MNPFPTRAKGNSPLPRNAPRQVSQGGLHETKGASRRKPWFTPEYPWPFWGRFSRKRSIGVGAPQNTLSPDAAKLGFSVNLSLVVGANSSGLRGGNFPATVGAVLNLSAAAIASGPAFNRYNNQP